MLICGQDVECSCFEIHQDLADTDAVDLGSRIEGFDVGIYPTTGVEWVGKEDMWPFGTVTETRRPELVKPLMMLVLSLLTVDVENPDAVENPAF
ncbi:hypothetical protein R6Q59_004113 [Mikania micrantha]